MLNNPVLVDLKHKMDKTIETFRQEISKVRTGKATTALLDGIKVEYYGNLTPLAQVANVSVLDPHTLSVTPWDKSLVQAIEKAILIADLGLNPRSDGTNLKIPIPPLNEERRKELVKLVKKFGEDAKIAIRNVRRESNDKLKRAEKAKEITEDELEQIEKEVQKITDKHIENIDALIVQKDKEIMTV
jgi:ribosome recycling factor